MPYSPSATLRYRFIFIQSLPCHIHRQLHSDTDSYLSSCSHAMFTISYTQVQIHINLVAPMPYSPSATLRYKFIFIQLLPCRIHRQQHSGTDSCLSSCSHAIFTVSNTQVQIHIYLVAPMPYSPSATLRCTFICIQLLPCHIHRQLHSGAHSYLSSRSHAIFTISYTQVQIQIYLVAPIPYSPSATLRHRFIFIQLLPCHIHRQQHSGTDSYLSSRSYAIFTVSYTQVHIHIYLIAPMPYSPSATLRYRFIFIQSLLCHIHCQLHSGAH